MDYKKKIEIPFGAFDSELMHQEINIPNGFKAVINGNKIILTRVESEDEKIRKALISVLKSDFEKDTTVHDISVGDIIAWLEKQGEEQPIIRWHSINEEPEEMKELFCEWESDDATWHDVAFYDKESHTFRHAKMPINVTKWVYVDELLEEQAEVVSDKDDIEAEEEGIREAFNKIEDEKQCKQKPQRMISAEAKEAMYNKPANTVEPKCEESKTKIFDAPTPFEDKLYAFVLACEILVDPSKREFILEHSQEILDAAREQIGKEQKSAWSEEDEYMLESIVSDFAAEHKSSIGQDKWLKSLKQRIGG